MVDRPRKLGDDAILVFGCSLSPLRNETNYIIKTHPFSSPLDVLMFCWLHSGGLGDVLPLLAGLAYRPNAFNIMDLIHILFREYPDTNARDRNRPYHQTLGLPLGWLPGMIKP